MKILSVMFRDDRLRLYAGEYLSSIDLSNPVHEKTYKLTLNKELRMLRIDVLRGPAKDQTVWVPLEHVWSIRATV